MSDCKHAGAGEWIDNKGYYCKQCGVQLCTDCGSQPSWWASSHGYCRRDNEKGGHRYESERQVDVDLVLAYFDGDKEKTLDFLDKCRTQ